MLKRVQHKVQHNKGIKPDDELYYLTSFLFISINSFLYFTQRGSKWIAKFFTPLDPPSIYGGNGRNRKHQLLMEDGVKDPAFLTGFTQIPEKRDSIENMRSEHIAAPFGEY